MHTAFPLAAVKRLLTQHVSYVLFQQSGIAPLHIAVALPDETGVEITELLLKSGADPNIRDSAFGSGENGRTAGHIACSREDNDKVLLYLCVILGRFSINNEINKIFSSFSTE